VVKTKTKKDPLKVLIVNEDKNPVVTRSAKKVDKDGKVQKESSHWWDW